MELTVPTLQHERPLRSRDVGLPWDIDNQVYVALFGGVVPVAIIALLNAERLGVTDMRRRLMWLAVGLGFIASVLLLHTYLVTQPELAIPARSVGRRINQLCGLFTWLALARLQRPAERRYDMRVDDEAYGSLWGPGIAAVIGGGLLGSVLTIAAVLLLGHDLTALRGG